jgi:hypothetical protein
MTTIHRRAVAGLVALAAFAAAAPAQAHDPSTERCEAKLERLETRFRQLEERRGYEAAAEWWNEHGWPRYYAQCGG